MTLDVYKIFSTRLFATKDLALGRYQKKWSLSLKSLCVSAPVF